MVQLLRINPNGFGGDYRLAFTNYENQMRPLVNASQKLGEGAQWLLPNTKFRFWFINQIWKILPYTPWKNMMIKVPLKAANSVTLKDY